jgi:uncharacterized membrane protein YidH (DUF202 family)
MNIVWGLIIIIVGVLIVVFGEKIYNFTGNLSLIERKFPGTSRGFIKLIGIIMILGGLLILSGALGFLSGPLGGAFSNLFGGLSTEK